MSPLISHIKELGLIEARAIPQNDCFKAALQFAQTEASWANELHGGGLEVGVGGNNPLRQGAHHRNRSAVPIGRVMLGRASPAQRLHAGSKLQGIVPAPEPTHALAETIREALRCK